MMPTNSSNKITAQQLKPTTYIRELMALATRKKKPTMPPKSMGMKMFLLIMKMH